VGGRVQAKVSPSGKVNSKAKRVVGGLTWQSSYLANVRPYVQTQVQQKRKKVKERI
jgi:hypothetical protein